MGGEPVAVCIGSPRYNALSKARGTLERWGAGALRARRATHARRGPWLIGVLPQQRRKHIGKTLVATL
jgi:hypothetical protein